MNENDIYNRGIQTIMKKIFSLFIICIIAFSTVSNMVIHAESRSTGVLTIHKYEKSKDAKPSKEGNGKEVQDVPDGMKPVEGVTFEIKRIQSFGILENNENVVKEEMKLVSDAPITKMTDANGEATFKDLPLGRYEVKAIQGPDRIELDKSTFIVDIPMTSADGKDLNYDVHIYPKNEVKRGSVQLVKKGEEEKVLQGAEFQLFKRNDDGKTTQINTNHSLVTDADGKLQVDFLEYGDYYFTEKKAPAGYIVSKEEYPFSIKETGEIVKIDVKNYKEPIIEKSVNNNSKTAGINRETDYTYDIKTSLPEDIQTYKKYVITDTLDNRLQIQGNPVVMIDGERVDNGIVTVTVEGQKVTATIADFSKIKGKELHLQITAQIKGDTPAGVEISNEATIDFTNKEDSSSEKDGKISNPVFVTPTMGIVKIEKVDGKNHSLKLEGAKFELQDKKGNLIKVNEKVMNDVTDEKGSITWNEIPYGEYEIVETEAPSYKDSNGENKKYQKLREPIHIKIDADHKVIELKIENNKSGWIIPATGGIGTFFFTVVGMLFMITALFVLYRKKAVKNK